MQSRYKRVLIKISGEALQGKRSSGLDHIACQSVGKQIHRVASTGVELSIVIGGGNHFRGTLADEFGFDRSPADHIGMLATAINGLALAQVLRSMGVDVHVMSAIQIDGIVEKYNWAKATSYLKKGVVVIFVCGTGNPYFTTDTAAAVRACEIDAELIIKGTKVDGVYSCDPMKQDTAQFLEFITYDEVLSKRLQVMDGAAVALLRDNKKDLHVANIFKEGSLLDAITLQKSGTRVSLQRESI